MQLKELIQEITAISPIRQKLQLDSLYITDTSVLRDHYEIIVGLDLYPFHIQVDDTLESVEFKGYITAEEVITFMQTKTKKN